MKTLSKVEGTTRSFIMTDIDPAQHDAIRDLYYTPVAEGFAKQYTADTPHLDRIYQNFARYAAEMVQQAKRPHPRPLAGIPTRLFATG